MSQDPPSPVQEGDIVAGKYRIERVLGRGGMGLVVAAMHLELEQRVALKFLLSETGLRPDDASRFSREARAAARIRSEHVARVIDVGSLPSGAPYMVMEYMDGEDLEQVITRNGPMPFALAVGYVLEACEAVAEAHSLGIVHRDLKPANLFLAKGPTGMPTVKVLDFGISKQAPGVGQASLTKTSAIMGSPRYMSPEQMRSSKTVDARSDVWALGTVLYQLLACAYPFRAETMHELIAAVLEAPPVPLASIRLDVPPGLDLTVGRCLEKDPARRFANVAELANALAPFGPPRSDISLERISQVLGLDPATLAAGGPAAPRPSTFADAQRLSGSPPVPNARPSSAGPAPAPNFPSGASVPGQTHPQWSRSVRDAVKAPPWPRRPVAMGITVGLSLGLAGVVYLARLSESPAVPSSSPRAAAPPSTGPALNPLAKDPASSPDSSTSKAVVAPTVLPSGAETTLAPPPTAARPSTLAPNANDPPPPKPVEARGLLGPSGPATQASAGPTPTTLSRPTAPSTPRPVTPPKAVAPDIF